MKYEFSYEWAKNSLAEYSMIGEKDDPRVPVSWLLEFDDSEIAEGERLNILLAVVKRLTELNSLSELESEELYLYYEQLVKGELDDVINPEEREQIVNDLTYCFNIAFPKGLES